MDQESILIDRDALSIQVARDDSDDENDRAAEEQNQAELEALIINEFNNISNSDEDDESRDEFHDLRGSPGNETKHFGELSTEEQFSSGLLQRNAHGQKATSTPYAQSQRPGKLSQQMLSPWSVNKNNNHHESTPQKILKEKLNRRALAESGNRFGFNFDHELRNGDLENPVGADIRPPPSRPDSEGRLRSAYDRVKEMENGISTGTGYGIKAGGDSALPNLRNGALSRSADVGNLLRQESINPQTREEQLSLLSKVQARKLEELTRSAGDTIAGLEDEVDTHLIRLKQVNEEKATLAEELEKARANYDHCNKDLMEHKSLLRECRNDMDRLKEEKQDVLRRNYLNEGTLSELKRQLEEMTSSETVALLNSQHQEMILRLKSLHQSDIEKLHGQFTTEGRHKDQLVDTLKKEVDLLRGKLNDSESARFTLRESMASLEREMAAKGTTSNTDRRLEEQTIDLLQLQLRLKIAEVTRLSKQITETGERYNDQLKTAASESSRLRDEISRMIKENTKLVDDQTAALTEGINLREELKKITDDRRVIEGDLVKKIEELKRLEVGDRNKQTEISKLQNDLQEVRQRLAEAEQRYVKQLDQTASLEREKSVEMLKLKDELVDLRRRLSEAESTESSLKESANTLRRRLSDLEKELVSSQREAAGKVSSRCAEESIDLLQRQIKLKEDELALTQTRFMDESKKSKEEVVYLKEVRDRLHSQLKGAADENYELREERNRLHSEIHGMKKVLKKLRKYMSGNPSPGGDSGIYSERKSENAGSQETRPDDAVMTFDRNYGQELMNLKGEYRSELERKYQQQLDIDRRQIITQIDAIYSRKLQQVLIKMKSTNSIGNHQAAPEGKRA